MIATSDERAVLPMAWSSGECRSAAGPSPGSGGAERMKANPGAQPSERNWWRALLFMLFAGLVVVGHGCHGEHVDDELSATPSTPTTSRVP